MGEDIDALFAQIVLIQPLSLRGSTGRSSTMPTLEIVASWVCPGANGWLRIGSTSLPLPARDKEENKIHLGVSARLEVEAVFTRLQMVDAAPFEGRLFLKEIGDKGDNDVTCLKKKRDPFSPEARMK